MLSAPSLLYPHVAIHKVLDRNEESRQSLPEDGDDELLEFESEEVCRSTL